MKFRQDITQMSDEDIDKFAEAFNRLYRYPHPAGPSVHWNRLAWWVSSHVQNFRRIHRGPVFLPWHRYFLHKFEQLLQNDVDEHLTIPYWDPTRDDARDLFTGKLQTFTGMSRQHRGDRWGMTITRVTADEMDRTVDTLLPTLSQVRDSLANKPNFYEFRQEMEYSSIHTGAHFWVGGDPSVGHMSTSRSPWDPLFFLHHCNVDRLWAIWQRNNPHLTEEQQYSNRTLHRHEQATAEIDEQMEWLYDNREARTPRSVLDHTSLGYGYERDVRLEESWFDKYDTILITGDKPLEMDVNAPTTTRIPFQAMQPQSAAAMSMPVAIREEQVVVAEELPLIGNKNTKELHDENCAHVDRMNDENKVEFEKLQDALDDGYNGCHFCLDAFDTD